MADTSINTKVNCFMHEMDAVLSDIQGIQASSTTISPLSICTMTVSMKTSVPQLSVDDFVGSLDMTHATSVFGGDISINDNKSFYNSVTFRYKQPCTNKKRAIKVFSNGSLHMTGFRTLDECFQGAENMVSLINTCMSDTETVHITDFSVQLINTCLKVSHQLNMEKVVEVFKTQTLHKVLYDVERHPGLQLKVLCQSTQRTVTVIIFRTGSVLITGVHSPSELLESYKTVTAILEQEKHNITSDVCEGERKKKKQKVDKSFDYGNFLV